MKNTWPGSQGGEPISTSVFFTSLSFCATSRLRRRESGPVRMKPVLVGRGENLDGGGEEEGGEENDEECAELEEIDLVVKEV